MAAIEDIVVSFKYNWLLTKKFVIGFFLLKKHLKLSKVYDNTNTCVHCI